MMDRCLFCEFEQYFQEGKELHGREGSFQLFFDSGRCWLVNGMTPHYVRKHLYCPSNGLIQDVMGSSLISSPLNAGSKLVEVGFLTMKAFDIGITPAAFAFRLADIIAKQKAV